MCQNLFVGRNFYKYDSHNIYKHIDRFITKQYALIGGFRNLNVII